jgi:hypothetical protein
MKTEYWFGGYRVYEGGTGNVCERLADWHEVPYPFERISQKSFIRWVESGKCRQAFHELNPGFILWNEAFRPRPNDDYTLLVTISVDDLEETVVVSVGFKMDGQTRLMGNIRRYYNINTCMNLLSHISTRVPAVACWESVKEYLSTSQLVKIEREGSFANEDDIPDARKL